MCLGKSGSIGVIMEHGRQAQVRLEPFDKGKRIPARDLMAGDNQAWNRVNRAPETDAHAGDFITCHSRLPQQFVYARDNLPMNSRSPLRGVDGLPPQLAERLALATPHGDLKLRTADFDTQKPAHKTSSMDQ